MVNFRRLTDQAKKLVDKRGGTDALKEDAGELKDIACGKGTSRTRRRPPGRLIKPHLSGLRLVLAGRPCRRRCP